MLKKLVLIGLVLCAFLFVFNAKPTKANPADLWVPYNYPTIQAAINAANSSDIIHVVGGPYAPVVVNKSVSLIGEGEAIIDGNGAVEQVVVDVTANQVSIKNFKIQNTGFDGIGIRLVGRTLCYLENNQILNTTVGIYLDNSSQIHVVGNNITVVNGGIDILDSSNNYVLANNILLRFMSYGITVNWDVLFKGSGFNLLSCNNITGVVDQATSGILINTFNNTICNNWVSNCKYGIRFGSTGSENNTFYHNNFINNTKQTFIEMSGSNNKWNFDCSIGGNFWSDHITADKFSGQYQNQPGSDGICDTPYIIDGSNIDEYPLMGPCNRFEVQFGPVPSKQEISVISNSSISDFQMNTTQKTISFNVTGETGIGFCRVDIPNVIVSGLWQNNYRVLVNNQEPLYVRNWTSGATTYIYFQYQHSTKEVVIIPEFPQNLIPLIFMIITTLIAVKTKRRQQYKLTPSIF
jgi:parallel beta-helix repeat protein